MCSAELKQELENEVVQATLLLRGQSWCRPVGSPIRRSGGDDGASANMAHGMGQALSLEDAWHDLNPGIEVVFTAFSEANRAVMTREKHMSLYRFVYSMSVSSWWA